MKCGHSFCLEELIILSIKDAFDVFKQIVPAWIKARQNEKMLLDPQSANQSKQVEKVTQLQTRTMSYGKRRIQRIETKSPEGGPRGLQIKRNRTQGAIP